MPFQALLGLQNLKSFTKGLTCLSRYGDDVIVQAGPADVILSAMNSANTAFCRVKLNAGYFDKYKMTALVPPGLTFQTPPEEENRIRGQLVVKSLLSILKHKTVEKAVDRCSLSIIEGGCADDNDTSDNIEDNLETKLIVRLHCKHGVVKTHKLLLLNPNGLIAPRITPSPNQSQVIIGPRALKDIIEHFPQSKGAKSDPQLVWLFATNDVKVKTLRGQSQISTEITMSADEFDSYQISEPPVSLGFLLREFNATISLADSLSVALDLRFTQASSPIVIEFDTDSLESEYLFVISTTDSVYDPSMQSTSANLRKRVREGGDKEEQNSPSLESEPRATKKKSQPAAFRTNSAAQSQVVAPAPISQRAAPQDAQSQLDLGGQSLSATGAPTVREPLFMPGASQLSNADLDILRGSGLGIEHMDYEEFEQMMEAEGEEVGTSTQMKHTFEKLVSEDEMDQEGAGMVYEQLAATQVLPHRRGDKARVFLSVFGPLH
ncbi:Rad9-domain-containing protein [Hysterangium stoloniferum]|nr:Rad9-domain-containing protein [Hysterangium stoloniferum]